MTLGTGIFLSSLVLGLIALFVATKDRWVWKKIIRNTAVTLLVLVLGGGAIGFIAYKIYKMPKRVTSFAGVSLDATPSDVKFLLGEPNGIATGNIAGDSSKNVWLYTFDNGALALLFSFKDSKVISISTADWSSEKKTIGYTEPLHEISFGNNLQQIENTLGKHYSIIKSDDVLERKIFYPRYNLFFDLNQNSVVAYGIYNPKLQFWKIS